MLDYLHIFSTSCLSSSLSCNKRGSDKIFIYFAIGRVVYLGHAVYKHLSGRTFFLRVFFASRFLSSHTLSRFYIPRFFSSARPPAVARALRGPKSS